MKTAATALCFTVLACSLPTTSMAAPVTDCGQAVTGVGELIANLDCSAYAPGPAIALVGILELNGFTLTGNSTQPAVECDPPSACEVRGAGVIQGGLNGIKASTVVLRDAEIVDSVDSAVYASADIRNSSIRNSGGDGVYGLRLKIRKSEIVGSAGHGAYLAEWVDARDLTVARSGQSAIYVYGPQEPSRLVRSVLEDNYSGIVLGQYYQSKIALRIVRSILRGNSTFAAGTAGGAFAIRGSEFTGQGETGVFADYLKLSNTNFSGNCLMATSESCCADIEAGEAPSLRKVQCETSWNWSSSCTSYGICSLD